MNPDLHNVPSINHRNCATNSVARNGRDDDGAELVGTLVFRHALANLQRCQNFLMQKNTKSCISVERQFQQVHAIFISTVEAIENNKQTWHRQPRL
jgi:hypothetical protein